MRRLMSGIFLAALLQFCGCGGQPGSGELDEAQQLIQQGEFVQAKSLLETYINRYPAASSTSRAYNFRGVCDQRLGKMDEAREAFKKAIDLDTAFSDPLYNLGVICGEAGEVDRAGVLLEKAALEDPVNPYAYEMMGYFYNTVANSKEAMRTYKLALERDPGALRLESAIAMLERHHAGPPEAVRQLQDVLIKKPDYLPAIYNLAVIYRDDLNNASLARRYFESYAHLAPEGARKQAAIREARGVSVAPPLHQEPAVVEAARPEVVVVEHVAPPRTEPIREMVAEPVKPVNTIPSRVETLMDLARQAKVGGRTDKALQYYIRAVDELKRAGKDEMIGDMYRRASEECFDLPEAHYRYGCYLRDQGKYTEALAVFRQAAVLGDKDRKIQQALASVAMREEEYETAARALKMLINQDANDSTSIWALAKLYRDKLNSDAAAERLLESYQKRFPDGKHADEAYELMVAIRGAAEPAVEVVDRTVAPPPRRPVVSMGDVPATIAVTNVPPKTGISEEKQRAAALAFSRATHYQKAGDWPQAEVFYLQALRNNPQYVDAYRNLGLVYRKRGRKDKAERVLLKAAQIDPKHGETMYHLALTQWELYKLEMDAKNVSKARRKLEAAEQNAQAALQLLPRNASTHFLMGAVYACIPGKDADAERHYRGFLKLAPNDPAAPAVRNWLNR